MLAEQTAEIERIVIPHGICDLANGIIRVLQKTLGVGKTQLQEPVICRKHWRNQLALNPREAAYSAMLISCA